MDSVYGENTEMYLKTLMELAAGRQVVPVTALADRLGVSTVSASEKVRRLQDQGFVEHLPYKGVQLTTAGLKRANTVLRRHRLWERFLVDHLQVEWAHAHDAACRLEHATSREISERLAIFLNEPETCPHGNPIPAAGASSKARNEKRLDKLNSGGEVVIHSVFPESTALLEQVASLKLLPGTACRVISLPAGTSPAQVSMGRRTVQIPDEIAAHLYVRLVEEKKA